MGGERRPRNFPPHLRRAGRTGPRPPWRPPPVPSPLRAPAGPPPPSAPPPPPVNGQRWSLNRALNHLNAICAPGPPPPSSIPAIGARRLAGRDGQASAAPAWPRNAWWCPARPAALQLAPGRPARGGLRCAGVAGPHQRRADIPTGLPLSCARPAPRGNRAGSSVMAVWCVLKPCGTMSPWMTRSWASKLGMSSK